ncbi:MAG: hypothetical protein AB7N99_06140 [Simkaniaceae bacterium]|nr:hypothetical protein [Chlamydiia bacterium]
MNLLPLSLYIFSLLAGNSDMGSSVSDVKGEITRRYKSLQVEETLEETHHELEPLESAEDLT